MDNNTKHTNGEDAGSGLLDTISRSQVFTTPENYFEKLPVAVSDRIHSGKGVFPVKGVFATRMATVAGFAMIALVAASIYVSNIKSEKPIEPVLTYDEIVNSGVVAELSETMIFEELDARETETAVTTNAGSEDDVHLKEYLIENNTDISLIINEL